MTLSLVTLVTRPGKWFRADSATGARTGLVARSAENFASAAPSSRRRPPLVRTLASWPLSTQRRTVSPLTPSNSAASPTVKDDINHNLPRRYEEDALIHPHSSIDQWTQHGGCPKTVTGTGSNAWPRPSPP